jgi:hypothetical protein
MIICLFENIYYIKICNAHYNLFSHDKIITENAYRLIRMARTWCLFTLAHTQNINLSTQLRGKCTNPNIPQGKEWLSVCVDNKLHYRKLFTTHKKNMTRTWEKPLCFAYDTKTHGVFVYHLGAKSRVFSHRLLSPITSLDHAALTTQLAKQRIAGLVDSGYNSCLSLIRQP